MSPKMSKASSVVAIVTQQSRQRVPQSRTEYRECQKGHTSSDGIQSQSVINNQLDSYGFR